MPDLIAPGIAVVGHPVLAHRVTALRDRCTDGDTFRQLVGEITHLLAYEALPDLRLGEVIIDTPVADGVVSSRVIENILVVPVLRAGLGMVQAIQEVVPLTEVAHVGLRRDEATLRSEVYLNRLPRDLDGRRVLVCDPMLATGGSLVQVCDLVRARGAKEVIVLCIIASAPGIAVFAPPTRLCAWSAPPWTLRSMTWATSCPDWATPGTGSSVRRTEPIRLALMRRAAVALDLVVVLLFVGIGRAAHDHGLSIGGMASTAWPFVGGLAVGWAVLILAHRVPVSLGSGALVCGATVAVGMALRVIAGQGTAVAFVVVALCFLGASMCGWRLLVRLRGRLNGRCPRPRGRGARR